MEFLGERVAPERLVLEIVAGVRPEEQSEPLESLIGREHLVSTELEGWSTLTPSCRGDGDVIGNACPPERLLEAGRALESLGGAVSLTSLCGTAVAIEERNPLAEAIRVAGAGRCLPAPRRSRSGPERGRGDPWSGRAGCGQKLGPRERPAYGRGVQRARLDPAKILETTERLERRIVERFPDSGLSRVCIQLVELSSHAKQTCSIIRRPNLLVRYASYALLALMVVASLGALMIALVSGKDHGGISWAEGIQVAEAAINDVLLLGAAGWFIASYEVRRKRGRVIRALQELRTLAHLIDVHQLSKTPALMGRSDTDTASSPVRNLSVFEMGRYLDYCSEMLSLNGKIAALYGDGFEDAETLQAVTEVEELCIGLQRKIWQKMILLRSDSAIAA